MNGVRNWIYYLYYYYHTTSTLGIICNKCHGEESLNYVHVIYVYRPPPGHLNNSLYRNVHIQWHYIIYWKRGAGILGRYMQGRKVWVSMVERREEKRRTIAINLVGFAFITYLALGLHETKPLLSSFSWI